jgi:hypothetical protein
VKTKRPAMCFVCDTASHKSTSHSEQKLLFSALKSMEDCTETSYHMTEVIGVTWLMMMVMKPTKVCIRLRVSYISI